MKGRSHGAHQQQQQQQEEEEEEEEEEGMASWISSRNADRDLAYDAFVKSLSPLRSLSLSSSSSPSSFSSSSSSSSSLCSSAALEVDQFVSLGSNCHARQLLEKLHWGGRAGPFDAVFSSPEVVVRCLGDSFDWFLDASLVSSFHVLVHP